MNKAAKSTSPNLIRQYIQRYNDSDVIENVGCFVATKDESGQISIGWSMVNPREKAEIDNYNKRVKEVNSVSWKARNAGANPTEFPTEKAKSVFDKTKAVDIALKRATSAISLSSFRKNTRGRISDAEIFRFIDRATKYFKDGAVKICS